MPPMKTASSLNFRLGVAPDGVYIDQIYHYICGKLLPHLFTLTIFNKLNMAVIFCCTFLKVSLTGRYPASLLYGARTFLVRCLSTLLYATIQFTLPFYFTTFHLINQSFLQQKKEGTSYVPTFSTAVTRLKTM